MPTKTFQLTLKDGHALIHDNDKIILVDTGAPVTIHNDRTLNFMNYDFSVTDSYMGITIRQLCNLLDFEITTLLGMDKIKLYKTIFDYPNKRITFSNNNKLVFEGEKMPLKSNKMLPVIDIKVDEVRIPCFFDTGAKLSFLHSDITKNLKNLGDVNDFHPAIGSFFSPTFKIETKVGSKSFTAIFGNLPESIENQLLRSSDGNYGIIGFGLLNSFKISMDILINEFKISESSLGEDQIPDDIENDLPDFLKYDSIMKSNNKR